MNKKAAELAEQLRQDWSGPLSEAEAAFLRDVQAFIAFAVRNGLTFPMVAGTLTADLNEIARDGFDYNQALARGFRPKVSGYGKLTEEDFGGSEDEEPSS
jgi:hypothetical protein